MSKGTLKLKQLCHDDEDGDDIVPTYVLAPRLRCRCGCDAPISRFQYRMPCLPCSCDSRFHATKVAAGKSDAEAIKRSVVNRRGDFFKMVVGQLMTFRKQFFAL